MSVIRTYLLWVATILKTTGHKTAFVSQIGVPDGDQRTDQASQTELEVRRRVRALLKQSTSTGSTCTKWYSSNSLVGRQCCALRCRNEPK